MPQRIYKTWTDFMDACDDYEVVRQESWRWGTNDTIIFTGDDHKKYMTTVQVHSQDGWQHNAPVVCDEVHFVPVTKHEWRPVGNSIDPKCTGHLVHDEFTLCPVHDHK